ncbi:DinB family protein [Paenibacillus qinlingensis]|uniref:Damage-inducible protein DinB n=1 Tax=Paenibacillus qinlingensis TaxID=1837343 RepID=A0ABU1NXH4_9BACL|nr:DinB family protein [Paenibacillus qinlingensis]MDR6551542.1 putative damage-inducible protein DinB [Paenibacillus qinlingensis]
MEQITLKQLEFIRKSTIKAVEGLSEDTIDAMPEGFNNNIRWNLGHIIFVQEKFAFHFIGEPLQVPENFERLFAKGTKPADWNEELPSLETLLALLVEQPKRIQSILHDRLDESVAKPFTTGNGLLLTTIGEFLNYTLYHEGMHFNSITLLKRFAANP